MDPSAFGMHGMPAGGAIAAAGAGGVDHIFKRHGYWRSESAKDGYVKEHGCLLQSACVYGPSWTSQCYHVIILSWHAQSALHQWSCDLGRK